MGGGFEQFGGQWVAQVVPRLPPGQRLPVETQAPTAAVHPPLVLLWTENALVAAAGSVTSAWIDVSARDLLRIGRTSAGGVYAFEIEWSRDGAAVDVTEVVVVGNNTTLEKRVGMAFARFRVRNTDAAAAFTAHRTTVTAR